MNQPMFKGKKQGMARLVLESARPATRKEVVVIDKSNGGFCEVGLTGVRFREGAKEQIRTVGWHRVWEVVEDA